MFEELISIANEEEGNSVNSAASIFLILVQQISEQFNGDIDSLEFPKSIKNSLKTLKAILGVFNTVKDNIKSKLKANGKN